MSYARATYFPVMAIIMAGRGYSPLRVLLAPLVAAFNIHLGVVGNDVRWCLLVATRGRLPTRLCGVEYDCLVASRALGNDVTWLLERASKEAALFALPQALLVATGQRAWVALLSLATNLRLVAPPCHCLSGAWDEKSVGGDSANLTADGTASILGRLVSARAKQGVESV
jgi:hypothetical protein